MAMGMHDDATLNISTGFVYLHAVGTAFPGNVLDPEADGWVKVGHTSASEIVSIKSTGGDKTTLATLQSAALRESISPKITTYGFQLAQFDLPSLQLYYGTSAVVEASGLAAGLLAIPDDPTPAEKALLIVVIDGTHSFGWYSPKTSIVGSDDISLADSTALSFLPIQATPLNYLTYERVYTIPIAIDALAVPNATSVSPTSGAAGTKVVITGTNFDGITAVTFGGTNAGMFRRTSATTIEATTPAGLAAGSKPIAVTNAAGTDSTTVAFTAS